MQATFILQAADGIRVADVTGVQTCALPISQRRPESHWDARLALVIPQPSTRLNGSNAKPLSPGHSHHSVPTGTGQIGRASSRERVYVSMADVSVKEKTLDRGVLRSFAMLRA